ncbi:MAG: DNA repair protein RecO [candidate division Zixibacteria bacterium]|nr:DNA repair protein RecO [candidate division Zixibacteria bacterium]
MGIIKSGGIVIDAKESGETSKLAEIFTEQFGLMKVLAKGARRPESRFGAATEPLTLIQGVYYVKEDNGIANLSAADIVSPFQHTHDDINKYSYGSAWAEILVSNLPYSEPQKRLYSVFHQALKDLEDIPDEQVEKFFWAYALKFIALLGYRPEFMICSGCSVGKSDDWMFSVENGRLYCKQCSQSLRDSLFMRLDSGETRILSVFSTADRTVLERITIDEKQMKTVRDVIEGFRRYHIQPEGELKSLQFREKINKKND